MWAKFSEGLNQIKTFFRYLNEGLTNENKTFFTYFVAKNCYAIIVMPSYPSFEDRRNTQRNKELSKFKEETGFEIMALNEYIIKN